MNNSKKLRVIFAVILSVFIVCFGLLTFIMTDQPFSENENRPLQQFPKFSFSALFSGKYIEQMEKYFQDQFPFRDFFVGGKAQTELILGKEYNNGVYLGKDGYMIGQFQMSTQEEIDKRLSSVNNFAKKLENVKTHFLLAPTSNYVNRDKLSADIPDDELKAFYDYVSENLNLPIIDTKDTLKDINAYKELYFKTDHHWNSFGAYYAYVEFCKELEISPVSLDNYEKVMLSEDFIGTMYSKGGFFFEDGEDFFTLQNKTEQNYKVVYDRNGEVLDTFYKDSHLSTKDKYAYFLDGNHAIVEISNDKAPIDEKILIVKDSYANAFVPFLADTFKEVVVIDLRSFVDPLSTYISDNGVDQVLFLYNAEGFMSDTGVYRLR